MTEVYYEDEQIQADNQYVLHYRNGFTGEFKKCFDNKHELNKEVEELIKQEFTHSGKKGHKDFKSFYVTWNNEYLKPIIDET